MITIDEAVKVAKKHVSLHLKDVKFSPETKVELCGDTYFVWTEIVGSKCTECTQVDAESGAVVNYKTM